MSIGHLAKRWYGSLRPKPLDATEQAWIDEQLLPTELELWQRMSKADKRHSYIVGRRAERFLGQHVSRPALAAAVLHDIGKIESNAGTSLRVLSTLVAGTAGPDQIESWSKESGWLGRAGTYLRHHIIGEELLIAAGSDPITSTWAREHELVHTKWTLPEEITDALYKADNI